MMDVTEQELINQKAARLEEERDLIKKIIC